MTFSRMEMLFLLWLAPVLALVMAWGARRRRIILRRFASPETLPRIAPEPAKTRRWIRAALLVAAVLLTVIALSGPQYGYRWQTLRQRGVDIIIALDCSRSMNAADIAPSRLDRAKHKVTDLLALLQGDRVGLTAFAGTAFLQCPLTLDYSAFHLFLNVLEPDYLPVGGTDISAALTTAMAAFDPDSAADKAIILITDGEHTGPANPLEAAEALRQQGIRLFCIGVGSGEGVPVPEKSGGFKKDQHGQMVLSRLDESALRQLASLTGGTYVRSVAGDMDLEAIYTHEIRQTLSADTISSGRLQVWEDRFQWPLVLALICLFAELTIPVTRKTAGTLVLALILVTGWPPGSDAWASEADEGIRAYETGQFEQAITHFTAARLAAPDAPRSLYNLGCAYYKNSDFEAAADHYQKVLETDPKALEKSGLEAHARYNLGNARFRQGDINGAIDAYETALSVAPEDPLIQDNLAFARAELERQQQPVSAGEKSDPENADPKKSEQNSSESEDTGSPKKSDSPENSNPNAQPSADSAPPEPETNAPDTDPADDSDASSPEKSSSAPDPNPSDTDPSDASPSGTDQSDTAPSDTDPSDTGQMPEGTPDEDASAEASSDTSATTSDDESGAAPSEKSSAMDPDQARRLLNRLEDRPGRALMPTRPRQVEKDW